jgi:hypothetical protein
MIILKERRSLPEGKRPKTWFDYIMDHLNSDAAFDLLYNIFDGFPYARGPQLVQAVSELKKYLPSVPNNDLKDYVEVWVKHHQDLLKNRGR